jgi:hypothetical protein
LEKVYIVPGFSAKDALNRMITRGMRSADLVGLETSREIALVS